MVNNSKARYYQDIVKENSDNPGKLWQTLHLVLNRTPKKITSKSLIWQTGLLPSSAARLRKFVTGFSLKMTRTTSQICLHHCLHQIFHVSTWNRKKTKLLKFINQSPIKSCQLDPLPTYVLKECVDILLPLSTQLVNPSLTEGCFPDKYMAVFLLPPSEKVFLGSL